MKIEPVVAQLRSAVPLLNTRVAGAAEFAAAEDQESFTVPCAFVVPLEDDADDNTTAGGLTQVVEETIGVMVSISNTADERGQTAVDLLEDIRQEIFTALLAWPPAAGYGGLEYRGGFIFSMTRARLWWRYDFSAQVCISS